MHIINGNAVQGCLSKNYKFITRNIHDLWYLRSTNAWLHDFQTTHNTIAMLLKYSWFAILSLMLESKH